ncbi:MAG TPA: LIC20035 family adhesin [Leptospiraceae bacterium]|nr:LIC20035 family adhesin [Leptospiraceae bacterium]HMW03706.1 LIC20035 family adhesin [Leptospiraceae bacterium]HMX34899.1 LIC20035 family adhesin [Leptospiraceae bacterium]HMY29686.1 LIC20035 family adhesin [Leptospiraceae bacterium]HMZ64038.1 LIC20035 family adhesin [Leptospiraceae bacterium]
MYFLKTFLSLLPFLFLSCASLMQKDAKTEFSLETPNIRIEKFPGTFNLKGKGPVKTNCAANNCSAEQISKLDAGSIKGFVKDGLWEEYTELTDKEDEKKKYSVLWMKGSYKDGKKEGMWEEYEEKYDPTTKTKKLVKKQIGAFKENKKDGVWTLLYETGEKLKETPFVDGKKHGTEKKYNQKGAQIEETNYVEGEREGVYWKKNSSELTECEGSYTKEQKTGKWTEYNTDDKKPGKLKAVNLFVKDKKDGISTSYHADGSTKLAEGVYKEDFKTGPWKQYYDNGKIESEGVKKPMPSDDEKDLKDQESSCPFPNKSGKSINFGEWKKYYKSGDLFSIGSYDEKGLPTKEWKFYYKGNKLRCKGVMANALMMQSGELYDKTGNLEGKGNMMLSMFNINEKTDEMEDKMIPALPFTFFKDGKKYMELLPATSGENNESGKTTEVRKQTTAIEYDASGKKVGEGPYMFIPTQPYGGKKNGCWAENGKKVPYLMGKVQTGKLAEMSDCK